MTEEKKLAKRLAEFEQWIEEFSRLHKLTHEWDLQYIDDAANVLNDWYWYRVKTDIHTQMKKGNNGLLHHSKIISGTELAIVAIQPIQGVTGPNDKVSSVRKLNSELAWFISLTILKEWNDFDAKKLGEFFENDSIKYAIEEHTLWLEKLDPEFEYPIFSNAQTWRWLQTCAYIYIEDNLPIIDSSQG